MAVGSQRTTSLLCVLPHDDEWCLKRMSALASVAIPCGGREAVLGRGRVGLSRSVSAHKAEAPFNVTLSWGEGRRREGESFLVYHIACVGGRCCHKGACG